VYDVVLTLAFPIVIIYRKCVNSSIQQIGGTLRTTTYSIRTVKKYEITNHLSRQSDPRPPEIHFHIPPTSSHTLPLHHQKLLSTHTPTPIPTIRSTKDEIYYSGQNISCAYNNESLATIRHSLVSVEDLTHPAVSATIFLFYTISSKSRRLCPAPWSPRKGEYPLQGTWRITTAPQRDKPQPTHLHPRTGLIPKTIWMKKKDHRPIH
jgi:hypothetical protein